MNYKRITIGDNIGFTSFADEKFKTCSVCIYAVTEMDGKKVSDNAVAFEIAGLVNAKIKTIAEMNEQLSELYGASLHSGSARRGDLQYFTISANWLDNKYAIENEDITARMLGIVADCLFEPCAENGAFEGEIFRLAKKMILDGIDAELNDKRDYTVEQARRIAFKGEPAENFRTGTRESVEAVTAESAFKAYKRIMETAQFEIMFVSPDENSSVAEIFKSRFEKIKRTPGEYKFYAPSPVKSAPETVSEEFDVLQSKIAMNFKYDTDDKDAVYIMNMILGGTPVSKLFMNVREKLSLCYYCASRMNEYKNSFMVDCGVKKENIEKTEEEILRQLDEIRRGNITDDEIRSVFLALENSYTSFGDTPFSYVSWYFDCYCKGNYITPQEYLERLFTVTKERIVKAAESVRLDSTYRMLNREAE